MKINSYSNGNKLIDNTFSQKENHYFTNMIDDHLTIIQSLSHNITTFFEDIKNNTFNNEALFELEKASLELMRAERHLYNFRKNLVA